MLVLLGLYALVIGAGNARAWSGSDAGGRVATVKWMADHHSWTPQVGYWANNLDPAGVHHPLYHSELRGGRWIQPASVPFLLAGAVLWRVGGAPAILVLAALGSLTAALAGRRLARLCGAESGWGAFWLVGATGPAIFYAGDFWEHAAALGAVLACIAVVWSGERPWRAALAGLLGGLGVVLRPEMAVYLVGLGIGSLLVTSERAYWRRHWRGAVTCAAGLAAALAANALLEQRLLGVSARAGRAAGSVGQAGSQLAGRLRDAVLTTFGLAADDSARALLLGAMAVAGLAALGWLAIRQHGDASVEAPGRPSEAPLLVRAVALLGPLLVLLRVASGAGFVPGMLPATPASPTGLVAGGRSETSGRARVLVIAALVSLPPIWALQWRGQLLPQWGGRYELLSGALLTIVGCVALERAGWRTVPAIAVAATSIAVGGLGVAWHIQRTNSVSSAVAMIERTDRRTVVISTITHLGREAGAVYGDHRWLSAEGSAGLRGAGEIARRAGAQRVEVVTLDDGDAPAVAPELAGFGHRSDRRLPFLGFRLLVSTYQRS